MEITIAQEKFAQALSHVAKATSAKPNIPILSNILIEVTKNDLRLSATNLEIGVHMWIGGNVTAEGKITTIGKQLADFVSANNSNKIKLHMQGDNLIVSSDKAVASFHTIPATEFPILPKIADKPLMTIPAQALLENLPKVLFACALENATSKIQHTGVLFEMKASEPNSLTLVGLNSHRLSKSSIDVQIEHPADHQLIIPAKGLNELLKIVSSEDVAEVNLYLSENKSQVIFQFADVEFSLRLIEGPFPKYDGVIPQKSSIAFNVTRADLESAVKIVNTFARSALGYRVEVDLDVETSSLILRSKVPDLGINETKIPVSDLVAPHDLKTAFNLQYLNDVVNHFRGEELEFSTNSAVEPTVFRSIGDKEFLHLVMPLQRD